MNTTELLKSFEPQNELNPKIWFLPNEKHMGDPDAQSYKMKPEVRERLLEIAYQFLEYVGIDLLVTDIVLTGSLSNYNWSKYSDFDIHIIINYNQFSSVNVELYKELFKLKKILFNKTHDIKLFGYETELYVEGEEDAHFSSGVYSLLYNKWQNKPEKEDVKIDKDTIKRKAKQWMGIIDGVIENIEDEDIDVAKELIDKYKEKLRKFRTCGLEKNGEYSSENLVFKILRRNGYLKKLRGATQDILDKKLSMKQ
jgi:predicted nucleotidyltransferase